MNVPIWTIIGFQQRDIQESKTLNSDTSCRLPVTNAQCIIATDKYPAAGFSINYDDDDKSQGYERIKQAFRALTENDIFQS